MKPPQTMIDFAIEVAKQSPCAKSKRGAVLFDDEGRVWGKGWNGPPYRIKGSLGTCDGSSICREHCAKRCQHAETRAIMNAASIAIGWSGGGFPAMLHVKIDEAGHLVAGGGPSCWQCSRLIADTSFLTGVWLYQSTPTEHEWRWYSVLDFHQVTVATCGIE